jgi:hypothetical protein
VTPILVRDQAVRPSTSPRRQVSVAVKFDQAFVADAEVVGDFMEHNPPHFTAKCLRVVPVESYERTAEDRDLVRQHRAVRATASGERHALIETKQRLSCRWLVFDDDVHIRHPRTQVRRQRVECVLRVLLKFRDRIVSTRLHEKRVDPARLLAQYTVVPGRRLAGQARGLEPADEFANILPHPGPALAAG